MNTLTPAQEKRLKEMTLRLFSLPTGQGLREITQEVRGLGPIRLVEQNTTRPTWCGRLACKGAKIAWPFTGSDYLGPCLWITSDGTVHLGDGTDCQASFREERKKCQVSGSAGSGSSALMA